MTASSLSDEILKHAHLVPGTDKLSLIAFNPGTDGIFASTSTLIIGEQEIILVDAQFQKRFAEELVEVIKKENKPLTYIYISEFDPDYYFGAPVIKKAFPKAKVVSTAETAYLIAASKDDKLAVWKDKLGDGAPSEIIVPEPIKGALEINGARVEIKLNPSDQAYSYLWIPSEKAVLGGVSFPYGSHMWLADSQGRKSIDTWIAKLDEIKKLNPSIVIPSHYQEPYFKADVINFARTYLADYQQAAKQSPDAAALVKTMKEKYPDLAGESSLEFSAKVTKGDVIWKTLNAYPAIGRTMIVDFGSMKFELEFNDHKTMTFKGTGDSTKGLSETIHYTAIEVAADVFMVYWHEPKSKDNVVHIQDFNNNVVYTNISDPATPEKFLHLKGAISFV